MYEIINITTKVSEGIFATVADAEAWIASHGDRANYRIILW